MTRIMTALFDDLPTASKVVRELEEAGVSYRDISVVSNDKEHSHVVPIGTTDDAVSGAGTGTAIGAAVGGGAGLLAGLGLLAIPGFGPLAAVGWFAAMAGGAAAGAAAGGMTGLLVGAGLSDEEAEIYSAGLRQGGTLVALRVGPEHYDVANSILARGNAKDISGNTHISGQSKQTKIDTAAGKSIAQRSQHEMAIAARSASSVIRADRVQGTSVYDPNGKHLGTVDRLMIKKRSGRVAYVVMSYGGIHGMGGQVHFIPWSALTYDTHLQGYRTTITEDQVRSAPDFYRDPNWTWSETGKERELHQHYGIEFIEN